MQAKFVHIPKAGGTALERNLPKYCSNISGWGHTHTSKMVTDNGQNAVVVLRQPEDRFRSAYSYWKYGSADINMFTRKGEHIPSQKLSTIGEFIEAARDDKNIHHAIALSAINDTDGYTSAVHFAAQSDWIYGADPDRVHIVCYDSQRLAENMQETLKQKLDISCDLSKMPRVNVTREKDTEPLTNAQLQWLNSTYEHDYRLWDEHCASHASTSVDQPFTQANHI